MSGPLAAVRSRLPSSIGRISRSAIRTFASTSTRPSAKTKPGSDENFIGINDSTRRAPVPNVSATDEVAVDSMGIGDKPLQEGVAEAEKMRELQAPNRANVWSRSQMPREIAMSGPRFEQTIMEVQVSRLGASWTTEPLTIIATTIRSHRLDS